jgi:hypothetical protein
MTIKLLEPRKQLRKPRRNEWRDPTVKTVENLNSMWDARLQGKGIS